MPEFTRAQQTASFLSRVSIKGPNECWLWTGCTYNCGYGSFKWRGKMRGANRVAWEIANAQDIPEGMDVLHSCDVPLCVNPMHLSLGTHTDNMLDKIRKQRCTVSSLTPDQVRAVRKLLAEDKLTQIEIAKQFGVANGVISQIKCRRTYRHVEDECR